MGVDAQPGAACLTVSYNHKLTIRDNRRVRMVVESNWYQSAYAVHFVSDQNEKSRVETHARGWRIASSVGGSATGEDIVGRWLQECTRKDDSGFSSSRDLFDSWKQGKG